ncbi:MAG: hypothetical protein C0503_06675 [Gemmatimonas sp.]|nr:hypothetical protein [Gemmatimonas sp.]
MTRIELRTPRWVHVPFLIGDVILLAVFYQVFVGGGFETGGDAFSTPVETPLGMKLAFGFFAAIGVFMFFVLLYRIIKNPVTFAMDSQGVYLNPAGVVLGSYKWSEIAEIRETTVIGSPTGRGGPRQMPAVAIVLKDPDAYINRFPKLMSPLFKFREAEAGTPLLLEPQMFGSRYEEIIAAMRAEVAKHSGRS